MKKFVLASVLAIATSILCAVPFAYAQDEVNQGSGRIQRLLQRRRPGHSGRQSRGDRRLLDEVSADDCQG